MGALFLATGTCTLGRTTSDSDGNIIKQIPPSFEPGPEGGSVIIGKIRFTDDGMVQDGSADIYGDWDAAGYLRRTLELVQPNRPHNIPDFESIVKSMASRSFDNDCPFLDHCESFSCRSCIVNQWVEESEEK